MSAGWSRPLKRWPGWLALGVIAAGLLTIGAVRAAQPRTADERVQSIASRLACPVCDGESVAESRAASSNQIRERITELVQEGRLSDSQIVRQIDDAYPQDLTLTPKGSGLDLMVWFLPPIVLAAAIVGLVVAFRRWKLSTPSGGPSEEDRALVEQALDEQEQAGIAQR
jgi:cytochrome c-type biogenesis protein CcmH